MSSTKIVQVYRNLHKKQWSVRLKSNRRVYGHFDYVVLRDATFHVGKKGRDRVRREKRKNVHAYVEGEWYCGGEPALTRDICCGVYYNPYKNDTFVGEGGEPIHEAEWVILDTYQDGESIVRVPDPEELEGCPFCGEERKLYAGHISAMVVGVTCNVCFAHGPPFEYPEHLKKGETLESMQERLRLEAIKKWNRRPEHDQ